MPYKVTALEDAHILEIPSARHDHHRYLLIFQGLLLMIVVPFVICSYAVQAVSLSQAVPPSSTSAIVLCLGGLTLSWLLGAASLAYSLMWEFVGTEIINIRPSGITRYLKPRPVFVGETQYLATDITNIRVAYEDLAPLKPFRQIDSALYLFGKVPGSLVIDYAGRTARIGNGLTESEANEIRQVLMDRFGLS
jgi:hypothetical protein